MMQQSISHKPFVSRPADFREKQLKEKQSTDGIHHLMNAFFAQFYKEEIILNNQNDYDPAFNSFDEYQNYDQYYDDSYYNSNNSVDDEVFNNFYRIVNELTQKARVMLKDKISNIRQDPLFDEIIFYCVVFGIKLTLFCVLRKGAEKNFIGDI
jgi:hypothetical protein